MLSNEMFAGSCVFSLLVTVFNLGKNTVTLKRGDPFCSVYFLRVEEGATLYEKQSKRIANAYGEALSGNPPPV